MLAFESLTPEALLKEVAEFLRMAALRRSVNVTILDRKPRLTRAEALKRAREDSAVNALRGAANDLEGAAIVPANSILRTGSGWSLRAPAFSVGRNDLTGEVRRFATLAEAEAHVVEIEKTDPASVHAGDYYVDGPEELINPHA